MESRRREIEAGQRLMALFGDMSDEHAYGKISGDMSEQPRSRERMSKINAERRTRINKGLYLTVCALVAGATVIGCGTAVRESFSKPNASFGEADKTIESVVVYPGAKLREAPLVPNEYDPNNIETVTDTTITVPVNGEGAVQGDEANGEWYKVPKSALKNIDPDLNPSGDLWVSTQKADVNRTPDSSN